MNLESFFTLIKNARKSVRHPGLCSVVYLDQDNQELPIEAIDIKFDSTKQKLVLSSFKSLSDTNLPF